jgi:SPP1 family predicted phage head-tail adaptor
MLESGKLRHRVRIERLQYVTDISGDVIQDENGETQQVWQEVATVWAAVEPLSAREFIQSQAIQSQVTARIVIRHREDIDPADRLIHVRTGRPSVIYNPHGFLTDKDSGLEYLTIPVSSDGILQEQTDLPPVNAVAPVVSGGSGLGDVLTTTTGTWTGYPASFSYAYQWRRNGSNIGGATASSYTIVAGDSAASITCLVTATNAEGSTAQASNGITVQTFTAPVISGVPTISGTAEVGQLLTASAASVTGNPSPSRTWQWLRDGSNISGATSSTYTLVSADGGTGVSVRQTETNALGADDAASAVVEVPVSGFDPATLFASGEQGAWYDPSDFSTMFQDTDGTTPVTAVGQAVARINDKSGRGNHATQSNATARPILRQDSSGFYYLEFDRVDDRLATASFNMASTAVTAAAAIIRSASGSANLFSFTTSNENENNSFVLWSCRAITANDMGIAGRVTTTRTAISAGQAVGTQQIIRASWDTSAPSMSLVLNKSQIASSDQSMGSGSFGNKPLTIGSTATGGNFYLGRLYGALIVSRLLSEQERDDLDNSLGSLCGLSFD